MPRRACLPCTPNPPGRTCLPSLLYATLYDSNALAYPAPHPTRSRMHSLVQICKLAQKLLAYPVAPAPPPLGRSLLPTLPTAATKTCKGPAVPAYTAPVDASPGMCHACTQPPSLLQAGCWYGRPLMPGPLCPARPRPRATSSKPGRCWTWPSPLPVPAYPALSLRQGAFALSGSGNQVSGGPPSKCPLVRRTLPLGNLGEGGLTLSRS